MRQTIFCVDDISLPGRAAKIMNSDTTLQRIQNERGRGYSTAVVVPVALKSLIFVSGEVGRDSSGAVVQGGIEAEARQCFANIKHALDLAGATFKDVVRITAYLKDLADYPSYAKIRSEVFGANGPASATVGVSDLLLGAALEVDAIAAVSTSS
jgi:2-iminobutanoate/2-iminopropanoate deaminase